MIKFFIKFQALVFVCLNKTSYFCIRNRENDNAKVAQLIEHQPSKLRVAGLSPVFRSLLNKKFFDFLFAKVAQLVEHNLAKVRVAGSSPVFRSKERLFLLFAKVAQLVEHNFAKVRVAGSSPVFRSKNAYFYYSRK